MVKGLIIFALGGLFGAVLLMVFAVLMVDTYDEIGRKRGDSDE